MKIKQLKINSFGKLKDKEITLKDNINILFGKNEAGKSTIIKYIVNSIYGISKNKKGKEYSDFEKYQPWSGEEFSGRLSYELDDGTQYEIYRDFKKKNPKIFNESMEDISNQFPIDKSVGNQFFYAQTNVDEELFLSTLVANQQEVRLQKTEQSVLIQKIANLVGTGDDNTSYRIAMDRINRRQLDEIGTTRSREKPINIIDKKIAELQQEKNNLEKYENLQYEIEEKTQAELQNVETLEVQLEGYNQLRMLIENEKIGQEKIRLQQGMYNQNAEKIKNIDTQLDDIQEKNRDLLNKYSNEGNTNSVDSSVSEIQNPIERENENESQKWNAEPNYTDNIKENEDIYRNKTTQNTTKHKEEKQSSNTLSFILPIAFLCIINIIQLILIKNPIIKYSILGISIIIALVIGITYSKKQKEIKKQIEKYNEEQKRKQEQYLEEQRRKEEQQREELKNLEIIKEKMKLLENEVNMLEKNNKEITNNIQQMQQEIATKKETEWKNLIEKNQTQAQSEKSKEQWANLLTWDIQKMSLQDIQHSLQKLQTELNNHKIALHSLELDKNSIEPQLDKLARIEEEYVVNQDKRHELEKLNMSMDLAKNVLMDCYETMRNTITPKFTQNLSTNISKITKGKYSNVRFHDQIGLIVENENGEYVPATKLSVGTIEQLYLSLRLSMVEELSEEKLPIILDEPFAYFDDDRLENFLTYMGEQYKDRQIILFTCTDREEKILKNNGIAYNLVNLS